MTYNLLTTLSLLSIFPAVAAAGRMRYIQKSFIPMLLYMILVFIAELVSVILIRLLGTNTISYNIFVIISGFLIMQQFKGWENADSGKTRILIKTILITLVWLLEWLGDGNLDSFFSLTILLQSLVIMVESLKWIRRSLRRVVGSVARDPIFIFSFGLLVYYIFSFIVELFLLATRLGDGVWNGDIASIFSVINVLVNMLNCYAVLCIPVKTKYFLSRLQRR